jgi:succinoglycan biosynthesis protein ExoW
MIKVAVIIPYFQKREGILRRALASVAGQNIGTDIRLEVIVVDDGSPVPAKKETEGFKFVAPHCLIVVEQENSGVGAARNAALHQVSPDTDYIAFLDSDDIWEPQHLATSLLALEQGCDYYFCDTRRLGDAKTTFTWRSFEQFLFSGKAKPFGHDLYELNKEAFFDHCIRGRVCLIPAVVYRKSVAPDILFDTSLNIAGEDCLFLFQLIHKCQRIACSPKVLVNCADGVNIYAGTFSWDNPGHLVRYMGQILAFYKFRKYLSLSARNKQFIADNINSVRKRFAFHTVRYFLKKRELWPEELMLMASEDDRFPIWYPLFVLYVAVCYPLGLYDPLKEIPA